MSENGNQANPNRRTVLRTVGLGLAGAATVGTATTPVAAETCSEDTGCEWEDTGFDSDYTDQSGRRYKIEHGFDLTYYGSYKDNQNRIHHDIRVNNTGCSRYKYSGDWYETNHTESFDGHWTKVDANYASNVLLTGNDSAILGANPPSDDLDHSAINATAAAVEGAVGMIHPAFALALTAQDILQALEDDKGSEDTEVNWERHDWIYGSTGQPHEASNHWEFFIMMEDNCDDTYFEVTSEFYNYTAGTTYISKSYNIENTDCGGLSTTSVDWAKVPQSEIRNRPRLQAIAGGGPLYYAVLPIKLVEEQTGADR